MVKIRPYQKGDEFEIWKIHNDVLREVDAHPGNGPWDEDLKDIEASYFAAGGTFMVIESSQGIIGFGGIVPVTKTACEVRKMRILKEHQGKGLGSKLLQQLEQFVWEKGFTEVELLTTTGQAAANCLYEKSHYQVAITKELSGFVVNKYRKWLP